MVSPLKLVEVGVVKTVESGVVVKDDVGVVVTVTVVDLARKELQEVVTLCA